MSEYERTAVKHSAEHHAVNARGGLSSPGLVPQAKRGDTGLRGGFSSPGQVQQAKRGDTGLRGGFYSPDRLSPDFTSPGQLMQARARAPLSPLTDSPYSGHSVTVARV